MKKLLLSFVSLLALASSALALGPTVLKDADISGSNSKISGGAFAVKTGVVFTFESGSTLHLEAATVSVGTLVSVSNGNIILDPNGTGFLELLAKIYVGSSVTTPTALVHVAAGTASAGTAPLKLTTGTLLTSAEAGALEYDGTYFYVTQGTPVRERVSTEAATNAIASTAIDWSLPGNVHSKTLGANTTFTFSNTLDGKTIVVALTNTASNYTVTWPTVAWTGGAAPTQTVGAKTDVYTFVKIGSTIFGSVVQNMY
jgi:hypothetical protein